MQFVFIFMRWKTANIFFLVMYPEQYISHAFFYYSNKHSHNTKLWFSEDYKLINIVERLMFMVPWWTFLILQQYDFL